MLAPKPNRKAMLCLDPARLNQALIRLVMDSDNQQYISQANTCALFYTCRCHFRIPHSKTRREGIITNNICIQIW